MTNPSQINKKSIYFRNLNGLRFIAAFMVILHHYELSKGIDGSSFYGRFVIGIGKLGVMLFFTLSGFLITYLLLTEKKALRTIDIKKFYIRRLLRIWPLYYLIVLTALFVLNNMVTTQIPGISGPEIHTDFLTKCILFLCMLPNIAMAKGLALPFADQTWSIGVEEQFYLFWPILIQRSKNIYKTLLMVVVIYLFARIGFYILTLYLPDNTTIGQLSYLTSLSCFDVMAIGGFAAVLLYNNSKWLDILFSKAVQLSCFIITLLLLMGGVNFGFFQFELYGLLFALIILNLAGNKNVMLSLENKILHYLGKISYGLYMYHFMAIRFGDMIVYQYPSLKGHWVNFLLVLAITIFLSVISYEFFEQFFIKRKMRFSNILSGENYRSKE